MAMGRYSHRSTGSLKGDATNHRGRWRFGVLGDGYFNQPWFDEVCD
jgi:hypothetical protein